MDVISCSLYPNVTVWRIQETHKTPYKRERPLNTLWTQVWPRAGKLIGSQRMYMAGQLKINPSNRPYRKAQRTDIGLIANCIQMCRHWPRQQLHTDEFRCSGRGMSGGAVNYSRHWIQLTAISCHSPPSICKGQRGRVNGELVRVPSQGSEIPQRLSDTFCLMLTFSTENPKAIWGRLWERLPVNICSCPQVRTITYLSGSFLKAISRPQMKVDILNLPSVGN